MRPHKISQAILNVIAASDEVLSARTGGEPANLAGFARRAGTSLPPDGRTADAERVSALAE